MLASQLIYTGCGKDKTGAFSVWSKTLDITKSEENEIRDKMLYKRLPNLPYEPTPEEIETLFPKKMGYFCLSSGRMCLAQSVYIGNVYSDLDKRTGNYILHAFVFDKTPDILPISFIESALFKKELTYAEWHDNDAPEELPKVELPTYPNALTKQEFDAFFTSDKLSQLELLLQAIINASESEQNVTFHDKHTNLKHWYRAISLCLPKPMQADLTFNTFFTPGAPTVAQLQGAPSAAEVKVRNITSSLAASVYDYTQEVRAGRPAFNLETGLLPTNITVSKYVKKVVAALKKNFFDAIMLADAVGKIKAYCKVSFDVALDLHYLLNKEIEPLDGIAALDQAVALVKQFYPARVSEVADTVYAYGFASDRWSLSAQVAGLYKLVYEFSKLADKNTMIRKYVENPAAMGVNTNAAHVEFAQDFKNKAPFKWEGFVDYIFDAQNFKSYMETLGKTFKGEYLLFNTFAEALPTIAEDQNKKKVAMYYFVDLMKRYVSTEKRQEVSALLASIKQCGSKWGSWLIKNTYAALCQNNTRLSNVASIAFTTELAETCGDLGTAVELIGQLVIENQKDEGYIKQYVARYDSNRSFYQSITEQFKKDPKFTPFLNALEIYRFRLGTSVTRAQLQDYYTKFYTTGNDDGLFVTKLKQYLFACNSSEVIREGLSAFASWFKRDTALSEKDLACVEVIANAVMKAGDDAMKAHLSTKGSTAIREMLAVLQSTNYRIPSSYLVIEYGESMKRFISDSKPGDDARLSRVLTKLTNGDFYSIPKEQSARISFVANYFSDVIAFYFLARSAASFDREKFDTIYEPLFKPFYELPDFSRYLYDTMNRLDSKQYDIFFGDTVIYAAAKENKFAEFLLKFVDQILEEMGRGKRKKYFTLLLSGTPKAFEDSTKKFVETYQKSHESFLERIFGSFGKGDEDKDKGKDKDKDKDKDKKKDKKKDEDGKEDPQKEHMGKAVWVDDKSKKFGKK